MAESPVWGDLLRAILPDMRLELTRRGDYAVRAMLSLAEEDEGRRLSARRIAERMDVPPRFLPQVMRDLATAGLVVAYEGRAGGYRLARPPGTISATLASLSTRIGRTGPDAVPPVASEWAGR